MDHLKGYSNTKNLKKGGSGVGEKEEKNPTLTKTKTKTSGGGGQLCETFSSFPPPKKKPGGGGGQLPPPQYNSDDDFAPPPPANKLWETRFSDEHNADYYVHRESGDSVWERPPGV